MNRKLNKDDYYPYMRVVRSAKLKGREKAVLRTYADWYHWRDQRPCIYGLDQIAAWTGMSRSTATRAHARLEELGWVQVVRYGRYDPIRVWPTVGVSDPDYALEGYAKAHRYSRELEEVAWAEAFRAGAEVPQKVVSKEKGKNTPRGSHSRTSRHRGKSRPTPTFEDVTATH